MNTLTSPARPTTSAPEPAPSPEAVSGEIPRASRDALLAEDLERAGDECIYQGDIDQAKVNYGWAIDTYLEARCFELAIQICRKLIQIAPDVVRTHYSLAFLLIGQQRLRDARDALISYARAVKRTGTQLYAIPRLRLLAHVTDDPGLIAAIGFLLTELGAQQEGQQVLTLADQIRTGEIRPRDEIAERWECLLPVALRDL